MIQFILRSILFYRRSHLVVILAVAVSTAVIGGSLIVGDSVRSSLRQMTLLRLGGVSHILHAPRFVRESLADELTQHDQNFWQKSHAAPALLLPGSVEKKTADGQLRRATSVSILGLRAADWELLDGANVSAPKESGIVLGFRTATELKAAVGDSVSVWVELPSSIPRDSLLGERENISLEMVLTVEGVLPESAGASRFSLQPAQQLPYNAFIALQTFQQRLNLEAREASRRSPVARPARVNTILVGSSERPTVHDVRSNAALAAWIKSDVANAVTLQSQLQKTLTMADLGLRGRPIEAGGFLSVESDSMIVEDAVADAVLKSADRLGMDAAPTLVYLLNEINAADRTDKKSRYSMYSIVAGLDFQRKAPLGPFRLNDDRPVPDLNDNEIILSAWLADDLQVSVGSTVQTRWHEVGSHGDLPETHHSFVVRGILKSDDPVSVNRDLTPLVPGVTNVDSFSDWDQPFDMEMNRITQRDDAYWEAHKATPKAFVSLAAAEKFWGSRFGRYTSIRVASPGVALPADRLELLGERLAAEMQSLIEPEKLGLEFRSVRADGLLAAVGANDFTQLFLGFSFFLILSAILLAALMFQLNIQQRIAQIGLMEAVGFTARRARRFFVGEGVVVALVGSLPGALAAVYFAKLMIYGLTTWWIGAIGTQFLQLDVQPVRLVTASGISLILAVGVIWNAVRKSAQRGPRDLLAGLPSDDSPREQRPIWNAVMRLSLLLSLITAVGLPTAIIAGVLPQTEAFGGMSWKVVGFFLAGFSWLAVGLLCLRRSLQRRAGDAVKGSQISSLTGLSLANAARNPQRSLLTTALIAFAAFVIVAVGAGRRNPVSETPDLKSGNGGFSLVGQSSLPVLFDMNSVDGRTRLNLNTSPATSLPESTRVFSFRMLPGQDASCLNLFQAHLPGLLGATDDFIARGGFRFADTPGENPWNKLAQKLPDTQLPADSSRAAITLPTIPVIGDMNTLQFSLKKGMGSRILAPDEQNPKFALQVVGMLDGSIFQGVLVMSDNNLKRIAPEVSGARYFLIQTPDAADSVDRTSSALETALQPYGMDTERVSRRLADFLAVQNTYLSTFQMLGGLGLLVGTFGLAAVMMRNVIERRAEIALLRSLGFRASRIIWLVLAENSLLLFWGILTGSAAALIAMLPHLLSTGADIPWAELGMTLGAVLLIGTLAAVFPIYASLRIPIRDVLTSE
ncbi:MAG: ABC transporter permease [Planctomycetaceae bacterium]